MSYHDITPHLNKLGTLYLSNNTHKTGFIFSEAVPAGSQPEVIYFITITKAIKLLEAPQGSQSITTNVKTHTFYVRDVVRIRTLR